MTLSFTGRIDSDTLVKVGTATGTALASTGWGASIWSSITAAASVVSSAAVTSAVVAAAPYVAGAVAVGAIVSSLTDDDKENIDETESAIDSSLDKKINDYTNVGRNEICPCGSGLKFKQCHGKLT